MDPKSHSPACITSMLIHFTLETDFTTENRFRNRALGRMLTGECSSETDLSGSEESRTRQGDYCKALQPRLQRIPHGALCMGGPFRMVANLVKGPGLCTPTSANPLVTPGKMNKPEWSSFLWLKWFAERNTAVNNQLSRLYVWQLEDGCLEAREGIWGKHHGICHLIAQSISETPSLPGTSCSFVEFSLSSWNFPVQVCLYFHLYIL